MFRKFLIASAATIIAGATIATSASAAAPSKSALKGTGETKYCIEYEKMVGSHIRRAGCKTRAEWARDGFEVDKLLREQPRRG